MNPTEAREHKAAEAALKAAPKLSDRRSAIHDKANARILHETGKITGIEFKAAAERAHKVMYARSRDR